MAESVGTFLVGYNAGGDVHPYATITLFLADAAANLTGNLIGQMDYGDPAQGLVFTEQLRWPVINSATYWLKIEGLHGSVLDGSTQCAINGAGNTYVVYGNAAGITGRCHLKNVKVYGSTSITVRDEQGSCSSMYEKMTIHQEVNSYAIYNKNNYRIFKDCFIRNDLSHCTYDNYPSSYVNCLLIALTTCITGYYRGSFKQSTLWSNSNTIDQIWLNVSLRNCIVYAATNWTIGSPVADVFPAFLMDLENTCFYSQANPTEVANGKTIAQVWPYSDEWLDNLFIADPLFVNPGGTAISDYALQAASPCRALNQSRIANPWGGYFSRDDLGFRTEGLSNDIVLREADGGVAGGNWYKANKIYVLDDNHDFGIGGTSEEAALDPDVVLRATDGGPTGGNWYIATAAKY